MLLTHTHRLNELIQGYIDAHDLESTLEVGGDMRKIQHCFRRFKKLVKERPSPPGAPGSGGAGGDTSHEHDDEQQHEQQLDDRQTERLKEILEQRDNEICILLPC